MHSKRALRARKVERIQGHGQKLQRGILLYLRPSSLIEEDSLQSDVVLTVPCLYYYIVEEAIIH